MHPVLVRFAIASAATLAVTSCTGETDYDVLDDYQGTNETTSVARTEPADAGPRATPPRGTDAGTVAHPPDASVSAPTTPAPPPPATDAGSPPPKKKGKHHHDD